MWETNWFFTCSIPFFWGGGTIPRRLNFMCRCYGTFWMFHLHRWRKQEYSCLRHLRGSNRVFIRRYIKFRSRGIKFLPPPKKNNTIFITRRKFEIKNNFLLFFSCSENTLLCSIHTPFCYYMTLCRAIIENIKIFNFPSVCIALTDDTKFLIFII